MKTKKYFLNLIAALFIMPAFTFAQGVAINTDDSEADPSAMLDVKSTEKGLLIPRVALDDASTAAPVTNPAPGLLIYNLGGTEEEGFYYWNGIAWQALGSSLSTEISDTDGNTKIQVEANPNEDTIRMSVDGIEKYVLTDKTLEFRNNGGSVFIGESAGKNDDLSDNRNVFIGNSAGIESVDAAYNVAIGSNALKNNISGLNNTAIGFEALKNNSSGNNVAIGNNSLKNNNSGASNIALGVNALGLSQSAHNNTAIGQNAFYNNLSGFGNTGLGLNAGFNLKGSSNVAIGNWADYFNTTGENNTIIGTYAGNGTGLHSKSRSVFIGFRAGYFEETSDKLYIENSNSTNPLIWGDFANDSLKIYGTLGIKDEFVFPNTDGAAGQVMQTDGLGNVTWANPSEGSSVWLLNGTNTYYNNGFVGIGTDSPNEPLKIATQNQSQQLFRMGYNGNTRLGAYLANNSIVMTLYNSVGTATTQFRGDGNSFFNNGNVGIGTNTPTATLDINGDAKVGNDSNASIGGLDGEIKIIGNVSSKPVGYVDIDNDGHGILADIYNMEVPGNLGIGVTNPMEKLEVDGNITSHNPVNSNHVATKDYVDMNYSTTNDLSDITIYQELTINASNMVVTLVDVSGSGKLQGGSIEGYYPTTMLPANENFKVTITIDGNTFNYPNQPSFSQSSSGGRTANIQLPPIEFDSQLKIEYRVNGNQGVSGIAFIKQ